MEEYDIHAYMCLFCLAIQQSERLTVTIIPMQAVELAAISFVCFSVHMLACPQLNIQVVSLDTLHFSNSWTTDITIVHWKDTLKVQSNPQIN